MSAGKGPDGNQPSKAPARKASTGKAVVPRNKSSAVATSGGQMSSAQMARIGKEVRQMMDGSTVRPIQPARQYDVISMARAMNRGQFAERVQHIFEVERDAALLAIQSGHYVSWRCPDHSHDCQRIGLNGRCFCGHPLGAHKQWDGHAVSVSCNLCQCRAFAWVPSRPEEVGEFWLRRRPDFDEAAYRAKCKCKHTHEQHEPNGNRRCLVKGCVRCSYFNSAFLCAACDRHWELHSTFFETESMRRHEGRAVGQDYLPFAEAPGLKRIVMGGEDRGFDTIDEAIADSYGPHQASLPPGPRGQQRNLRGPQTLGALQGPEEAFPTMRSGPRGGNNDAFPAPPR